MDFTYRKFEVWGRIFFRILSRTNSADAWRVHPHTFDHDREDMARLTVQQLAANAHGNFVMDDSWRFRGIEG
jgi:hypothetical protein